MSVAMSSAVRKGWTSYRLVSSALRVVCLPALGGKVTRLDSVRTGRSWLWRNHQLTPRAPRPGSSVSYERDFDLGGWDELLPTVHPCALPDTPWGNQVLTDHGELWCHSWQVAHFARSPGGGAELLLELTDPEVPFRFTRALHIDGHANSLEVHYSLENRATLALPFLWAAHPLLSLEPGMRIELPPGTLARCTVGVGVDLPALGVPFTWPLAPRPSGAPTDLGRVPRRAPGMPGRAVKLFALRFPESEGWVGATAPDGLETLRFTFRTAEVPYVGLWINDGGWCGTGAAPYRNLGIEPTTSPCDTLAEAVAQGTAVRLAAQESRQWTMVVSVITGPGGRP